MSNKEGNVLNTISKTNEQIMNINKKPDKLISLEDTIVSLRQELRSLYESLKDKNEQLANLENDIKERDYKFKLIKSEYIKLQQIVVANTDGVGGGVAHAVAVTGTTNNVINNLNSDKLSHNNSNNNVNNIKSSSDTVDQADQMEIIIKLQKDMRDRDHTIKELSQKIIRLSDNLIFVQKESMAKEDRIESLQNENDRFKQVVRIKWLR